MERTNKTQQVLRHLQTKGTITSWEAITEYRATRLASIIFNLREHYLIDTIMAESMDGDTGYAIYVYKGEKREDN